MTLKKQTISKHKTASTQSITTKPVRLPDEPVTASPVIATSTAPGAPRAFDIIPRSHVRPSTTARPIITQKQTPVSDTTLKADTTDLKLDVTTADDMVDLTADLPGADEPVAAEAAKDVESGEGVLMSDLMAKRQAARLQADAASEAAAGTEAAAEAESKAPATTDHEPQSAADSDDTHQPVVTATPAAVVAPSPPVSATVTPATARPMVDIVPASPNQPPMSGAAPPDDDSLEAIMRDHDADSTSVPAEHSPELKDAMQNLTDKDGRPHHELYGGKSVIVVHKHHTGSSVFNKICWLIFFIGLAILAANFLLDAGILPSDYGIPHTDLL